MTETKTDKYILHEGKVQKFWEDEGIYPQLLRRNNSENRLLFRFMDGPPFVSSKSLHFGHILIGSMKDTVLRYYSMNGFVYNNILGFDCHGLPIEQEIDKKLGISTKADIAKIGGVGKYNKVGKEIVEQYSGAWEPIYRRIGRWADFDNTYRTLDTNFMESVWWTFAQMWKKGLVYEGCKVMPYSVKCTTPLSNFEASGNYKEKITKSLYVCFKVKSSMVNTYFVAWTTTPWTLPSNVTLCVNPDVKYVVTEVAGRKLITSEDTVNNLFADKKHNDVKSEFLGLGSTLVGMEYEPLYNYLNRDSYKVIADTFVEGKGENGTGIVHVAPAFGEIDMNTCLKNGITTYSDIMSTCLVDEEGNMKECVKEFAKRSVIDKYIMAQIVASWEKKKEQKLISEAEYYDELAKLDVNVDLNSDIIKDLEHKKLALRTHVITHSYPFCWRTELPLIYRVVSSYFVKVTAVKDQLIANNKKIDWYPDVIGSNRFHNWLTTAEDWCVSRSRNFGTPLPIWVTEDGKDSVCIESIDQLMQMAELKERPTDLHPESVNDIVLKTKDGREMKRVPFIFDCWFESGAVPIGQLHYPFENEKAFDNVDYLSDFITEGLDQTRGWFYTLLVVSTILFNKPPFKTVICAGLILDKDGNKLSKKNGNFIPPENVLNRYGSDVLRLYLLKSPSVYAEPLCFNEDNLDITMRNLTLWHNSWAFFAGHYKALISRNPKSVLQLDAYKQSTNIFDRWIISRLSSLVQTVKQSMKKFELHNPVLHLTSFLYALANWYIKINRTRLKGSVNNDEQTVSLSTLFCVLHNYTVAMAPFAPFLSEHMYSELKYLLPQEKQLTSVHLCSYPDEKEFKQSDVLESEMSRFMNTVNLLRQMRQTTKSLSTQKIPIERVILSHPDTNVIKQMQILEQALKTEININNVEYRDFKDSIRYTVEPIKKAIGTTFKTDGEVVTSLINGLDQITLSTYVENKDTVLNVVEEESKFELDIGHYTVNGDTLVPDRKSIEKKYSSKTKGIILLLNKLNTSVLENDVAHKKNAINAKQCNDKKFVLVLVKPQRTYTITQEHFKVSISTESVESKNTMTRTIDGLIVIMDTTYTESNHLTYQLTELIAHVQRGRKIAGLEPVDNITVHFDNYSDNMLKTLKDNIETINKKLKCDISFSPGAKYCFASQFIWKHFSDSSLKDSDKTDTFSVNIVKHT